MVVLFAGTSANHTAWIISGSCSCLIPVSMRPSWCGYACGMVTLSGRLKREHATLVCMTDIYCAHHHEQYSSGPCESCVELMNYSATPLAKCPYGQNKPTCTNCPIHCYKKQPREQVRAIMRFSGPRMAIRHPWRSLQHLADQFRHVEHPLKLRLKKRP